jgi:hypothetical protein
MILKRDYALYEPSQPEYGMRHSPLAGSRPISQRPVPRTDDDDPDRVVVVERILAKREAQER